MSKIKTFTGGVILKGAASRTDMPPVESFPAPSMVTIPLVHHSGPPAQPKVRPGDHVSMGQMIGEACDIGAAAVHAPVSGIVKGIVRYPYTPGRDAFSVVIENNGYEEFASSIPFDVPWVESAPSDLIRKLAVSGIIDYSGFGVPVHSKLAATPRKPLDTLIVSALATEPSISAGPQLLIEQPERVLTGILICKRITGASRCCIAIADNNPDIEQLLSDRIAGERFKEISILKLKPKYPQEREELLVRACTGKEYSAFVPYSRRNAIVLTAETVASIRDAIVECRPWYERVVTVTGNPVASPKHFLVRIGTPARLLLQACGTDMAITKKVLFGGPLSGIAIQDPDAPVLKSTGCILALDAPSLRTNHWDCIGCGRCVSVCPMQLSPPRLAACAHADDTTEADRWHIMECIECGCCAYVCPAKIDLVHAITLGKFRYRLRKIQAKHLIKAIA